MLNKHLLQLVTAVALLMITATGYSQNVGIGQNSPISKLDVKGNLVVGIGYSGTAAPTNGAIIQGNVGIGTTLPSALLTIGTSLPVTVDNSGNVKISSLSAGSIVMTGSGGLIQIVTAPETNTYLEWNGSAYTWATASALLANLTPGGGLNGTAYNGSTAQTWNVTYGSSLGTSVQGNTTLTVNPGTGMSGGGTITLGTGGTVTLNNTGVTSVGISLPGIFSVSASPVTTTGTLTGTLANETKNTIFAAPNGSTGTPTFRSLVNADFPTSGITAGTYNNLTVNAQGIATGGSNVSYLTAAVTSFSAGTLSPLFTTSVTTATTTPALSFTLSNTPIGYSIFGDSASTGGKPYYFRNLNVKNFNNGTNANSTTFLRGDGTWVTPAGSSSGWALTGNASTTAGTNFIGTTDATDFEIKTGTTPTERMHIVNSTGNVVIGSGEGTGTVSGNTLRAPNATGTNLVGGTLTITSGDGTGTGGSGSIILQTALPSGTSGPTANTMTEAMRIDSAGDVGIGGVHPKAQLDINGNLALRNTLITGASGSSYTLNPNGYSFVEIQSSGGFTLKNITAGVNGQVLIVWNSTNNMDLTTSGNITSYSSNNGSTTVAAATFIYDSSHSAWIMVSAQ